MASTTLIDPDGLRARFDIDGDDETTYTSDRLNPHIRAASRRLRRWVGDAVYGAALGLVNVPDPDAAGNEDLELLQNAEAHLAMHYAVLGFNSPISAKGVVATAMSNEGKEMRKYLTPKETGDLAAMYLDQAAEILNDLYPAGDVTPIAIALEGDTSCEAATRSWIRTC